MGPPPRFPDQGKSERRIMGKTAQERREINAIPLWVALRWIGALWFYVVRYWSVETALRKADRFIRDEDR